MKIVLSLLILVVLIFSAGCQTDCSTYPSDFQDKCCYESNYGSDKELECFGKWVYDNGCKYQCITSDDIVDDNVIKTDSGAIVKDNVITEDENVIPKDNVIEENKDVIPQESVIGVDDDKSSENSNIELDDDKSGDKLSNDKSDFCGISVGSKCSNDKECVTGGCSGQVCQGANEEPLATICDMRDCYVASNYGVECGCVDSECQWN